MKKEKFLKSKF